MQPFLTASLVLYNFKDSNFNKGRKTIELFVFSTDTLTFANEFKRISLFMKALYYGILNVVQVKTNFMHKILTLFN